MTSSDDDTAPRPSRRGFLVGAAGGLAAAAVSGGARAATATPSPSIPAAPADTEPFWGAHQGGILTPPQSHTYFAAFDLTAKEARRGRLRCCSAGPRRRRALPPVSPRRRSISIRRSPRPTAARRWASRPRVSPSLSASGPACSRRTGMTGMGSPHVVPRRSSICRASPATNCKPSAPAAIFRCRPAPTIRRSRSTPYASWRGSPTAPPTSAGRRPVSPPIPARSKRRAISWVSRTAPAIPTSAIRRR